MHADKLLNAGIELRIACRTAIAEALTDEPEMLAAINEVAASLI